MTAELPTAERDALVAAYAKSLAHPDDPDDLDEMQAELAVDVLLDRARQQGRDEQREEYARRSLAARGSQTAPSATENAETGGGA